MKRHLTLLALPLTALVLFAGCGGDDDSDSPNASDTATQAEAPASSGADAEVLDLQADPNGDLAYEEDTLDGKAGDIAIAFTNDAPVGHDVVIERDGKELARSSVLTGGSETVAFKAKPGEYTYYCSLPGHREAGMEGTLNVK